MSLAKDTGTRDEDGWFTLTGLVAYSGLSLRTIRRYMDAPDHPLPTHHIQPPGSERGRVLVSKQEFDEWVRNFPPSRSKIAKSPAAADRAMADRVARAVKSIRG